MSGETGRWRIYYGDGRTFDWQDGPPQDAPGDGVQVIAQMAPHRTLLHGGLEGVTLDGRELESFRLGFYWFLDGYWYIGDFVGLILHLRRPGLKIVKLGETIPTPDFHAIMIRASRDPDFPPPHAVVE